MPWPKLDAFDLQGGWQAIFFVELTKFQIYTKRRVSGYGGIKRVLRCPSHFENLGNSREPDSAWSLGAAIGGLESDKHHCHLTQHN